jgi:hypothetical protein
MTFMVIPICIVDEIEIAAMICESIWVRLGFSDVMY